MNRSKPNEADIEGWLLRRNTQCNFDTLLQVISLRSQPEVTKAPVKIDIESYDIHKFGFLYELSEKKLSCWKFEFEIQHSSVFENGIVPLGALYKDCDGVPMLLCKDQPAIIPAFLDTTVELKNVYFEIL